MLASRLSFPSLGTLLAAMKQTFKSSACVVRDHPSLLGRPPWLPTLSAQSAVTVHLSVSKAPHATPSVSEFPRYPPATQGGGPPAGRNGRGRPPPARYGATNKQKGGRKRMKIDPRVEPMMRDASRAAVTRNFPALALALVYAGMTDIHEACQASPRSAAWRPRSPGPRRGRSRPRTS
jgi:hypothetical protein